MRIPTRFFALAASLMLLAMPAAWACDELMGGMLECAQTQVARASTAESCHEEGGQALMDCCLTHSSTDPVGSARVEGDTSSLSLEMSSSVATERLNPAQHPAATDWKPPRWREPARYALFSSYLI